MEVATTRTLKNELESAIARLVRNYESQTGLEVTGIDRLTATTMGGPRPYRTTVGITVSVAL